MTALIDRTRSAGSRPSSCPAPGEVLGLGTQAEASSDGAFSTWLPVDPGDPDGRRRLDPSGIVQGWAA